MKIVRNGMMTEMVVTSETMEGLRKKFWKWKEAFESKGLNVNLGKTKLVVSGAEGEVSVSKLGRYMWYLWEASNGKFSVVCEIWEMDPWKIRKSKEGDPEVWKRFCVWKMQAG